MDEIPNLTMAELGKTMPNFDHVRQHSETAPHIDFSCLVLPSIKHMFSTSKVKSPKKGLSASASEVRKQLGLYGEQYDHIWRELEERTRESLKEVLGKDLIRQYSSFHSIPSPIQVRIFEEIRSRTQENLAHYYDDFFYDQNYVLKWLINNHVRRAAGHGKNAKVGTATTIRKAKGGEIVKEETTEAETADEETGRERGSRKVSDQGEK